MLAHLLLLAAILYATRPEEKRVERVETIVTGMQPFGIVIDRRELTVKPGEVITLYLRYGSGYATVTLDGDGTSGLTVIVRADEAETSNPADEPNMLNMSFKSYLKIDLVNLSQNVIKGFSPTIKIVGVIA